jgi:Na+/melibiose symporter-like transporter
MGPLSLPRLTAFSLANLPVGATAIAVLVYLPPYFTARLGVDMSLVGVAWGLVRIVAIAMDLAVAMLMDSTRAPIGRYRAWMIAGGPILMLALYKLFMAPRGMGAAYLIAWLLVLYLGNSIVSLSLSAWGASLTRLYHERSRLFATVAVAGVAGAVSVLLIPVLGRGFWRTTAQSVQAMGWFIIAMIPPTIGLAVLRTPDRAPPQPIDATFVLADRLRAVARPDVARLFVAQMALTLGPGWMSALYLFYFTGARGFSLQQASALLAAYVLAGLPGALGMAALARRIGKHHALMAATTAFSLGVLAILATPRADLLATLPVMIWSGAMASGFTLMVQAMLADVADDVRLSQGEARTGLLYAVISVAGRIAVAFSIFLTFPLLHALGFNPVEGAGNTPAALHNLAVAFIAGPVVFVTAGGACAIGWRLDERRQGEIRAALDAQEADQDARV